MFNSGESDPNSWMLIKFIAMVSGLLYCSNHSDTLQVIQQYELTCEQISSLTYQLACGLKFLQSLGIMHRVSQQSTVSVSQ